MRKRNLLSAVLCVALNERFAVDYNASIDAFADQLNSEIDETAFRESSTHRFH